jgi:hypothetical protein
MTTVQATVKTRIRIFKVLYNSTVVVQAVYMRAIATEAYLSQFIFEIPSPTVRYLVITTYFTR